MRIGELAKRAGVNTSRLRFYEGRGLLEAPARMDNGYRAYGERDLKIIAFIERAQRLGFSLREIRAFLTAQPSGRTPEILVGLLREKLSEIDAHIADARARRKEIVRLLEEVGSS